MGKRGAVPTTSKTKERFPVGPYMIGFFLFVVVGSSFLGFLQTTREAGSRGPPRAE